jgi:hypothetical protein
MYVDNTRSTRVRAITRSAESHFLLNSWVVKVRSELGIDILSIRTTKQIYGWIWMYTSSHEEANSNP